MRRKAPQGHRREPFLRNFLGEQKVPRRRQNARRGKKPGPQAQREQRPEGEKARAAGPEENNARRAEKRGPQAQREQRPEGEKKCFREKPGPQAQKKHSQLATNNPARRAKRNTSKENPLMRYFLSPQSGLPPPPLTMPMGQKPVQGWPGETTAWCCRICVPILLAP